MLKIISKCLNSENISKDCIRVSGPLDNPVLCSCKENKCFVFEKLKPLFL